MASATATLPDMTQQTSTAAARSRAPEPTSPRAFVLHVLEMLLVMAVGIGVCSGVAALVLTAAGHTSSWMDGPIHCS